MDAGTVQQVARECGFELAGIAGVGPISDYARYEAWVAQGFAGEMRYLTDRRGPMRSDVRTLLPSAKSVICVGKLYKTSYEPQAGARISRYAAGSDYHDVLREDLTRLVERLQAIEPFDAKICVDTAPVLERSLAHEAGLGWIGRNTCLINEPLGSWFFLGEVITSLDLAAGTAPPDRCGTCRRCIDACPTRALVPDDAGGWTLDSQRCISYLTIELRGPIDTQFHEPMEDWIYGCDICQEVCPWNSRAPVTGDPAFQAPDAFAKPLEDLASMSEPEFRQAFGTTPVARTKYAGLMRNVAIAGRNRTR